MGGSHQETWLPERKAGGELSNYTFRDVIVHRGRRSCVLVVRTHGVCFSAGSSADHSEHVPYPPRARAPQSEEALGL